LNKTFLAYEPHGIYYSASTSEVAFASPDMLTFRKSDGTRRDVLFPGNHGGVTVVPHFPDNVYFGDVFPPTITEFNVKTGKPGRSWPIKFQRPGNLTTLAFVPSSARPESGLFWAGNTKDNYISVFQVPLISNPTGNANATFLGTINPLPGSLQVSVLSYDSHFGRIYAIIDEWLLLMRPDGKIVKAFAQGIEKATGFIVQSGKAYMSCGSSCNDMFEFEWSEQRGIEGGKCNFTVSGATDFTPSPFKIKSPIGRSVA